VSGLRKTLSLSKEERRRKTMDQEKIIEILNEDRAEELWAIIQYMGHHYEAEGLESRDYGGI